MSPRPSPLRQLRPRRIISPHPPPSRSEISRGAGSLSSSFSSFSSPSSISSSIARRSKGKEKEVRRKEEREKTKKNKEAKSPGNGAFVQCRNAQRGLIHSLLT